MSWIRTSTRGKVSLVAPEAKSIKLRDIAHALAQINRFTGHTPEPYSVAEHCLIGSYVVPGAYALEFLLHDASEAFLGDVSAPLKRVLGESYLSLERQFEAVIAKRFELKTDEAALQAVKRVDLLMLHCELDVFFGRRMSVADMEVAGPDAMQIFGLLRKRSSEDVERAFLLRHAELMRRRA